MKYKKLIANCYFLFFSSIILSPYYKGQTIYLYLIIPFLDFYFIKSLFSIKIDLRKVLIILLAFSVLVLELKFFTIIRVSLLIFSILYLFYIKKQGYFYLYYKYIKFNIIIATFQFILAYVSWEYQYILNPKYIADFIWGSYSTPVNPNFYPIFFLKRASGLSREVGFFASIITISILLYISDSSIKKKKREIFFLLLGYIISFSKISLMLPICLILKKYKKKIDSIPLLISSIILLIMMIIISNYLFKIGFFKYSNITWSHRLGGFKVIDSYSLGDIFHVVDKIGEIINKYPELKFLNDIAKYQYFTGISEIIIHYNFIMFIIGILILKQFKINTTNFFILTLLTFNTGYFTMTSYVILIYFYIFYLK